MGIPHDTVVQLANEGMQTPSDLADFDKKSMKQVPDNLRNPGGRIPNPAPGAPVGVTIPRPPFVFGAKSQKRLLEACDLIRLYKTIGYRFTAGSIRYTLVIQNFSQQWKSLVDRKKEDPPEIPKVTKALPIIKWSEAFVDHCNCKIGSRTIPLVYVVRNNSAVRGVIPTLATDLPHSELNGSVEADLI